MWTLNPQQFIKPHIVHKNWEELGKIDSSLLRTMRHITFGQPNFSTDTGEYAPTDARYQLLQTQHQMLEEWPSEAWNFQGMHQSQVIKSEPTATVAKPIDVVVVPEIDADEPIIINDLQDVTPGVDTELETVLIDDTPAMTHEQLVEFFMTVKGIGRSFANKIVDTLGVEDTLHALNHAPQQLLTVPKLKQKKLDLILANWHMNIEVQG